MDRLLKSARHSHVMSKEAKPWYAPDSDYSGSNLLTESIGATAVPIAMSLLTRKKPISNLALRLGYKGSRWSAMLAAALTKRRTWRDQAKSDSESHALRNILIPGAGLYNMLKRLGSTVTS